MEPMKTLFLNPPSFEGFDGSARYQARREIKSFWYPTWLAAGAAMVPGSRLLDAPPSGMGTEEVIQAAQPYDLVIIHTSTSVFRNDVQVAERLKEAYPNILVGFVGSHPTVLPEQTLASSRSIDFVVVGEYDYTVAEIAAGVQFSEVKGIAFGRNGSFRCTAPRPPIEDLDALPFAAEVYARDLKIENYYIGYLRHPYLSFYTGRGCRGRCTFCLWPQTIGGRRYRVRSPETVYRELCMARELFPQVKEFFFDDDTFTDNPNLKEIARLIGRLGITWSCNARAQVPRETLEVLKENGLRLLMVGFESGNQTILNNVRKGTSIEGGRSFDRDAKEAGILIHAGFVLGLPGETRQTIEETMRFALEIDPYSIQVSLVAPYPGTELYEQAKKEGWLEQGEQLVQDGIQEAVLCQGELTKDEIFEALDKFYRTFYLRPRPILRILGEMLRDRQEFVRRIREGREFFSFMATRRESKENDRMAKGRVKTGPEGQRIKERDREKET